ncbi:hypothetical protein QQ045_005815 [Rhodiola kirilowii]
MEPQMPENLPGDDHSQAIEMLTQGRGLAFQLRDLFLNDPTPISEDRLVLAEDLLVRIHGSFTDSISALVQASESDEMKSEEFGESSKKSNTFAKSRKPAASNRSCTRKMSEGETWTEVASSLIDDGHAWRKYGQKPILNAKHSRNYYKCTHKDQFGCPAKKHVQQIGDDPLSYRTVYTFRHTCTTTTNITLNPPAQLILESSAAQPDTNPSSSFMINFQSNQQDHLDCNWDQLTLSDNLGRSLSAVGSDQVPQLASTSGMDHGFMTSDIDYSPAYMSYSHDSQDPWFS